MTPDGLITTKPPAGNEGTSGTPASDWCSACNRPKGERGCKH